MGLIVDGLAVAAARFYPFHCAAHGAVVHISKDKMPDCYEIKRVDDHGDVQHEALNGFLASRVTQLLNFFSSSRVISASNPLARANS